MTREIIPAGSRESDQCSVSILDFVIMMPLAPQFHDQWKLTAHEFGLLVSTYAYAAASTLVETLKRAGDNLTRENIMKVAASIQGLQIPLLLPGVTINTSATDFYPIQSEQLAIFKGERFELVGGVISGESK